MDARSFRFAAALMLALASPTWAQTFTKHTTTGPGPSERSVPAAVGLGRWAYVFGGVKDDFNTQVNTFYNDLYRLDTRTNTWQALTPVGDPPPRAFAAAVAHAPNDDIYIYGGATYQSGFLLFIAFGDLWKYSVASNSWTQIQAVNAVPPARSGAAAWIAGDRIFVFGGIDSTFSTKNDLWKYDISNNSWTELIPNGAAGSPPARHVAQAGKRAKQGKLTLYGGEGDALSGFAVLTDTWQYDIATNSWTNVTPMRPFDIDPHRNYGAAAIVDEVLALQGGDIPGGSSGCGAPFPQNPTEQLWKFDLATLQWVRVFPVGSALPKLKRHAAAAVRDVMYIFSGWDFVCPPGQIWNHDVYSFDPG